MRFGIGTAAQGYHQRTNQPSSLFPPLLPHGHNGCCASGRRRKGEEDKVSLFQGFAFLLRKVFLFRRGICPQLWPWAPLSARVAGHRGALVWGLSSGSRKGSSGLEKVLSEPLTHEKTRAHRLSDLPLVTQLSSGEVTKPHLPGPKRVISTTGPHCPAASSLKLILGVRGFATCKKS